MSTEEESFSLVVNPSMDFTKMKDCPVLPTEPITPPLLTSERRMLGGQYLEPISPLRSMAQAATALALQNTVIGHHPESSHHPEPAYPDKLVPYPPEYISTSVERTSWFSRSSSQTSLNTRRNSVEQGNRKSVTNGRNSNSKQSDNSMNRSVSLTSASSEPPYSHRAESVMFEGVETESIMSDVSSFSEVNCLDVAGLSCVDQSTETDDLPGLRYAAQLEGQLETLQQQVEVLMREKLQLQTEMSLRAAQLHRQTEQSKNATQNCDHLQTQLETKEKELRQWSAVISDYQTAVDSKSAEIKSLQEDLAEAEFGTEKMRMSLEEMKMECRTKDASNVGLKEKIAELHVEVQTALQGKVQMENEMKAARAELTTAQRSRTWYQDQLHQAHETANRAHQELIASQTTQLQLSQQCDQLSREKDQLSRDLASTQRQALSEKEALLRQLENIEADLLERESLAEQLKKDTSNDLELKDRLAKLEEEQVKASQLSHKNADMEMEIQNLQRNLAETQQLLQSREQERSDLIMKVTVLQKSSMEKDLSMTSMEKEIKLLRQNLQHSNSEIKAKDDQLHTLRNEKSAIEVALASANEEKRIVNQDIRELQNNIHLVNANVKQMKNDLLNKSSMVELLTKEKERLTENLQNMEEQMTAQRINFEATTSEGNQNYSMQLTDFKSKNSELEKIIDVLKQDLKQTQKHFGEQENKIQALVKENEHLKLKLNQSSNEPSNETIQKLEMDLQQALRKQRAYKSNVKILTRKLGTKLRPLKDAAIQAELFSEKDYEALQTESDQLKKQLEEVQQSIITMEKDQGRFLSSTSSSEQMLKEVQDQLSSKDAQVSLLSEELQAKEEQWQKENEKLKQTVTQQETELNKDRTVLKELRSQIFQEKRTVTQLKRQLSNLKNGLQQSNESADNKVKEISRLEAELSLKRQAELKHRSEMEALQSEIRTQQNLVHQLEEELSDTKARQPALAEQIKTLGWHLRERTQQLESSQQQVEQCKQHLEEELTEWKKQVVHLQNELASLRQVADTDRREKHYYKSRSGELRQALKTLLQQSRQDKDILNLSPAPFDKSSIHSLLEQSSLVPEVRPLCNVQACLNSLKQELQELHSKLQPTPPPTSEAS